MTRLRSIPINRRLWLILLLAILMLAGLGSAMLEQIHTQLYAAKSEKTRHVVESASGILRHYQALEADGTLTLEQAQQSAKDMIRGLRYDNREYFWINDQTPTMIMHPTNSKLEGQNLSAIKDPDGVELFNEMVRISREKGAGQVEYRWPKPGSEAPVSKISYVELFKPWGWIIGSGVYVDDVQAEFREQAMRLVGIGFGLMVVMALLVSMIVRSIS
ncbi:MAG TPA: methyl-accepting chemotaxis protein, partial [Pseudomonas sp.]|nr:methyl-accepting chemotaxis protein [Pseudomonas sp.]